MATVSVTVLLSSVDMSQVSQSASACGVSSNGFLGPVVSSLGSATSQRSGLLLLKVEIGLATDSAQGMRVGVFLTSRWGSSCL